MPCWCGPGVVFRNCAEPLFGRGPTEENLATSRTPFASGGRVASDPATSHARGRAFAALPRHRPPLPCGLPVYVGRFTDVLGQVWAARVLRLAAPLLFRK